jgi:hypothetical protein
MGPPPPLPPLVTVLPPPPTLLVTLPPELVLPLDGAAAGATTVIRAEADFVESAADVAVTVTAPEGTAIGAV